MSIADGRRRVWRAGRQSVRLHPRGSPRNLGLWPAQPVEVRHRSPDGRHLRGRQRLGIVGDGASHRPRRQLRLAGHGRPRGAAQRSQGRPDADPPAGERPSAHRSQLRHRRAGLSRQQTARPRRLVRLRRLHHRHDLGHSAAGGRYVTRTRRCSTPISGSSPSPKEPRASCTCSTTTSPARSTNCCQRIGAIPRRRFRGGSARRACSHRSRRSSLRRASCRMR